ncbi:hypothetical protein F2P56_030308 [Juglans regia]|uniref:Uncharacterized protein n=1 Tax=Juglans regia TaxID=51240 RepID=A0A833UD30_JUGRE|nr:hypothetical protein F2P56_030308 [Juglans regia]
MTVEALICTQNWLRTKPFDIRELKEYIQSMDLEDYSSGSGFFPARSRTQIIGFWPGIHPGRCPSGTTPPANHTQLPSTLSLSLLCEVRCPTPPYPRCLSLICSLSHSALHLRLRLRLRCPSPSRNHFLICSISLSAICDAERWKCLSLRSKRLEQISVWTDHGSYCNFQLLYEKWMLNIVALALANLIGGLFINDHNVVTNAYFPYGVQHHQILVSDSVKRTC